MIVKCHIKCSDIRNNLMLSIIVFPFLYRALTPSNQSSFHSQAFQWLKISWDMEFIRLANIAFVYILCSQWTLRLLKRWEFGDMIPSWAMKTLQTEKIVLNRVVQFPTYLYRTPLNYKLLSFKFKMLSNFDFTSDSLQESSKV